MLVKLFFLLCAASSLAFPCKYYCSLNFFLNEIIEWTGVWKELMNVIQFVVSWIKRHEMKWKWNENNMNRDSCCFHFVKKWFKCLLFIFVDNILELSKEELCSLAPINLESGIQCRAYFPSWTFNSTSGQCQRYIYGGCGRTANMFDNIEDCISACDPEESKAMSLLESEHRHQRDIGVRESERELARQLAHKNEMDIVYLTLLYSGIFNVN